MVTSFGQLLEFYRVDPTIGVLADDVSAHLERGFCYFSPSNLAMMRPVCSNWDAEALSDPRKTAALTGEADCWYVWAAIGDIDFLLSLIPCPLEWIAFARRKKGHGPSPIKLHKFQRFISHGRKTKDA